MWLILLACFLVVEAITVGLTTIWFAGGALVAAIASGLGAGILIQWVLFLVISLVLLIFTRPLAVRYMNKGVPKTNVNSLIGERAVVIQKINNLEQTGQVRINDIEWMARTSSDEVTIPEHAIVTIEDVQGVKLIVKEGRRVSKMAGIIIFIVLVVLALWILASCIRIVPQAPGAGCRTPWRVSGYLVRRRTFPGPVCGPRGKESQLKRTGCGL